MLQANISHVSGNVTLEQSMEYTIEHMCINDNHKRVPQFNSKALKCCQSGYRLGWVGPVKHLCI